MVGFTRSVLALVVVALVAGCAGAPGPSLPTVAPATSQAAPVTDRTVSEPDNDQRVKVALGATVTLVLHSTYWQVQGSSDPMVLALVGGPTASAAGPTACVPGAGCGTVTAVFDAVAPGRATITAGRTTCGEALLCTGSAGAYEVTIDVAG
jgi:hypothetical protein